MGKPKPAPAPSAAHAWPSGYADFVTRFGAGDLEGLVIFDAKERAKRAKLWTKMVPSLPTFFVNLRDCFPATDEATVVVLAASTNGDVVGFAPARPEALMLFPRGSDRIVTMGATWNEALATWCYGEHTGPRRVEQRAPQLRVGR